MTYYRIQAAVKRAAKVMSTAGGPDPGDRHGDAAKEVLA
jgi:hypothetical protein